GNTALTRLEAYNSRFSTLNVSSNTNLQTLYVYGNPNLTTLNASSNTRLQTLHAYSNSSLTSINVSGLTALTTLRVDNTKLTSINVNGLTALTSLRVENARLTSFSLTNAPKVSSLDYRGNPDITSIEISNNTALSSLPAISGFSKLTSLKLHNNSALGGNYYSNDFPSSIRTITVSNNSGPKMTVEPRSSPNLSTLNVTDNSNVTDIRLNSSKLSTFNVRNNANLTLVNVTYVTNLIALDLSTNRNLKSLYARSSNLASISLPKYNSMTHIDLENCRLLHPRATQFDLRGVFNSSTAGSNTLFLGSQRNPNTNLTGSTARMYFRCYTSELTESRWRDSELLGGVLNATSGSKTGPNDFVQYWTKD
ncbi:MAG: hypothetical protein ACRC9X_01230, partial [Bacteroidales bacterium]